MAIAHSGYRVTEEFRFNGQKILDGSFGNAVFQVGANVGETISVSLASSVRTTAIGKTADNVNGTTAFNSALAVGQQGTGVNSSALATGDLTIAVGNESAVGVPASASYIGSAASQDASSAFAKAGAINGAAVTGLSATADTTVTFDFVAVTDTSSAYTLTINSQAIYSANGDALSGTQIAQAINANAGATGVTAAFDSANNRMTLGAADGRNITLSQTASDAAGLGEGLAATTTGFNNSTNDALTAVTAVATTAVSNTFQGTIRLTSTSAITLGGANESFIGYADNSQMALGSTALNTASVTTVANANTAIGRVDAALSSVSTLRSTFGAIQNRFDSVIATLSTTSENLSASRSRVQDADFAQETANLSRAQILQQAGTAMVAQANQLPQGVLALLR